MLMTIIEGPDGCGKSSLVRRILEAVPGSRSVHHGAYLDKGPEILLEYLRPMTHSRGIDHLIFDRSWLSEPIYGWVMRKGSDRLGITGRRYLERLALSLSAVVIVPGATFNLCAERWSARHARGDEYLSKLEQLRKVYDLYAELGTRTSLPALVAHAEASAREILMAVDRARPPLNQGPGIGHWNPRGVTLLVGEQANTQAKAYDLPFINPQNRTDGCSFWLTEKLESWGVNEKELYWINAKDCDGNRTSDKFLSALQPRKIIALGKIAAEWCVEAGVEKFVQVDHPQYWKRFHHHEEYPLKKELT